MAVEALTAFPVAIVAGNTVRVTLSDGKYQSSVWDLSVVLTGAATKSFSADSVIGDSYELVIPASGTAALTPGTYTLTFVYTDGDERATVEKGAVEVLPDPTATRVKSTARQTLEAMESALLQLAAGSNQTVSFNGQSFTKKNTGELQNAISRQRGVVAAEESRANLLAGGRRYTGIYTRFSRNPVYCD